VGLQNLYFSKFSKCNAVHPMEKAYHKKCLVSSMWVDKTELSAWCHKSLNLGSGQSTGKMIKHMSYVHLL